ncbi:DUF4920 domain-containing protein [Mucilaginibacter flavus]|uniref:DUF4920 domain-containing protein n=1 Tax=Mucilaginibacter flavus TaxID=931504 RepID=UPI0025B53238|nr:DUF4920 domain-containing protein [Mucilaginibacter flavus]MDN3584026.1 DUF4920 domain-containing protein [Mucilaginibacter flavus]
MKLLLFFISMFCAVSTSAQKHIPIPHGMVYGQKPDTLTVMTADKVEAFMGKKTRITTALSGKVIRVTKEKGGWFEMDAGNGKIIASHFKDYNITLPKQIAGRTVIIDGIAQKLFIADDLQHLAGDTVIGKKQHKVKTDPNRKVTFEVRGLLVDK